MSAPSYPTLTLAQCHEAVREPGEAVGPTFASRQLANVGAKWGSPPDLTVTPALDTRMNPARYAIGGRA